MRIDSHVHVWTLGSHPFVHHDDMTTVRPEYPSLVEDLIHYMDRNRIDRTVLIQCMYHGYDNSYLCECLRRFPDRLHGVALLDPRKSNAAATLERLFLDHGVQGMRLYPIVDDDASWLSGDDQHQLWETARRLGLPFTWFGRCAQIPLLEPMLERYPEVDSSSTTSASRCLARVWKAISGFCWTRLDTPTCTSRPPASMAFLNSHGRTATSIPTYERPTTRLAPSACWGVRGSPKTRSAVTPSDSGSLRKGSASFLCRTRRSFLARPRTRSMGNGTSTRSQRTSTWVFSWCRACGSGAAAGQQVHAPCETEARG